MKVLFIVLFLVVAMVGLGVVGGLVYYNWKTAGSQTATSEQPVASVPPQSTAPPAVETQPTSPQEPAPPPKPVTQAPPPAAHQKTAPAVAPVPTGAGQVSVPENQAAPTAQTTPPPAAPAATPPVQQAPPPPPPPPPPRQVTIQTGTLLPVRVNEMISSDKSNVGDTFTGSLDQPLVIGGMVIAERGAAVRGKVVDSQKAGRVKGVSELSIEITQLALADGQTIQVQTEAFHKQGETSKKSDAAKIGIGAGIGAAIGAIAGGGHGAAIGAGAGGAAGTGTVLATRGKATVISSETLINFKIRNPVTITEKK